MVVPALGNLPKRGREAELKANLRELRSAIDRYHAIEAEYPPDLETLVVDGYLRRLPRDITGSSETWILVPAEPIQVGAPRGRWVLPPPPPEEPGIEDVRSGSDGTSLVDGEPYSSW